MIELPVFLETAALVSTSTSLAPPHDEALPSFYAREPNQNVLNSPIAAITERMRRQGGVSAVPPLAA